MSQSFLTGKGNVRGREMIIDTPTNEPTGYFHLPRELRDNIMDLALHPTISYPLVVKKYQRGHDRHYSHPYISFLSSCRRACLEGSAIFWQGNSFRFQKGPLSDTCQWLDKIGLGQGTNFENVTLVLGIVDCSPEMIYGEELCHRSSGPLHDRYQKYCENMGREVADKVLPIWEEKITFIQAMHGVENVCFVIGRSKLIARKIGQTFMVKRDWNDHHSPVEQHEVPLNLSKLFRFAHTLTAEKVWAPM